MSAGAPMDGGAGGAWPEPPVLPTHNSAACSSAPSVKCALAGRGYDSIPGIPCLHLLSSWLGLRQLSPPPPTAGP